MWNRLKAILADFFQQADLVLLGLCCTATVFGMVLIASATHYMEGNGMLRYVGVQGVAMLLGFCMYVLMSMVDIEIVLKKWKWLVAFNLVFIGLLYLFITCNLIFSQHFDIFKLKFFWTTPLCAVFLPICFNISITHSEFWSLKDLYFKSILYSHRKRQA